VFCFLFLVINTSVIDFLETLVSEMTYDVSSGTLNPTHLLTLLLNEVINLLFFQTSVMLLIAVGKRYN